jgi:hypothetical protein
MSEQIGGRKERRTAERIDVGGRLPSQLALDLDTSVVQISAVGMMVEVPMPLAIGSKHGFTLSLGNKELEVSGLVRNCQPVGSVAAGAPSSGGEQDQGPLYRVGIEFCDLDERQVHVLGDFVNRKIES